MTFASLVDPEEVRRALITSLAAIRCKCLHTTHMAEQGVVCPACEAWAQGGAAKRVARWLFRAAGAHTHLEPSGRWVVRATPEHYQQVGQWLEQMQQLAQGTDPDSQPRSAA